MRRMGKMAKRFVAVAMTFSMAAGIPGAGLKAFATQGLDTVQAASAVTRTSIHDGTILHAFCWNFNTIKDKIPEIAEAGYTAVQTSPINECLATHPGMALYGETEDEGRWYYHYQPTDWKIGNYQLGTRDEFKAMCDEAEKYGIGIIVDIAPNHTTPLYDQVSEDLKAAAGGEDALYHIGAKVENGDQGGMQYDNRVSVTYDAMGGLPDVDTENPGFQQYFYEFLEDCVECGADGFRIDTAKHIALPDDEVAEEYAGQEDRNNFYPNMKDALDAYGSKAYADLFVYGEVLDGDASRVAAYQDMLGGTVASNYGGAIRNATSSGNVSVKKLQSYKISDDTSRGTTYTADSDKLVTWVESHDNYINDKSYNEVDDRDVILGWAIISARKDGTPLFFSRPDGSSAENPWGNNLMGVAGSDIYKAPEVAAVNKFRTAMEGLDENLRNPGNNSSILMIERGDKGVVIVNASENDFELDSETNLADGTYADSVEGRDTLYTVADGNIFGTVPAKSVVVLHELADGDYSTLFFHNTNHWSSVSAYALDNVYPAEAQAYDWWKVTIPAKEFTVVFKGDDSQSSEFAISEKSGRYMTAQSDKLYFSKAEAEEALNITTKTIYFLNTEEWKTVNAYAWKADGTQLFGGWPGVACASDEGYWVKAIVKMVGDDDFSIIFNGEGGQTVDIPMDDMSKNYLAVTDESDGKLIVTKFASKEEAEEETGINADSITVHYYDAAGWGNVGVYTWGDIDLGSWPGRQCEDEGDGWWKATINAAPSSNLNIIFNNMPTSDEDKHQTEDMKADSLKKVYFIGANYKYGSKAEALKALESGDLKLEKNLNPSANPNPEAEPKVKEIEEEAPLGEDEARIYIQLDNNNYFDAANIYAWTDGENHEYFGGWPGKAMTHIGNGWYSVNVPKTILYSEEKDTEEETKEDELEEAEDTDAVTEATEEEKLPEEDATVAEDTTVEEATDDEKSEAEAVTEEVQEEAVDAEASEDDSVLEEINDTLVSFFNILLSAFSPMEVQAAEHQTFIDGLHLITNNGNGFQEDNAELKFTTTRPGPEALNQDVEEPAEPDTPAEPEKPVESDTPVVPDAPVVQEPGNNTENTTVPTTTPKEEKAQEPAVQPAPQTSSQSSQSSSEAPATSVSQVAAQATQISDAQTPTSAPEIKVASNEPVKTVKAKAKKATLASADTITDTADVAEEIVSEEEEVIEKASAETTPEVDEKETTEEEVPEVAISDEEVPLAADNTGVNPGVILGIIAAVLITAAGALVVLKRKETK